MLRPSYGTGIHEAYAWNLVTKRPSMSAHWNQHSYGLPINGKHVRDVHNIFYGSIGVSFRQGNGLVRQAFDIWLTINKLAIFLTREYTSHLDIILIA